jgi:DNA-binding CsgD family transcriptional regulator
VSDRLNGIRLERLAAAVAAARHATSVEGWGPMLALTTSLDDGQSVTVDFSVHAVLGHPLVVVTHRESVARPAWYTSLTPRERQVADLVAAGLSNAAIARRLDISVLTTKDHVHHVLDKSAYRRRAQIAAALAPSAAVYAGQESSTIHRRMDCP